jgi:hypothetical protein
MAWEEFQIGSVRVITGDTPYDEMRHAVDRINRAYLERFGRRAYLAELLCALEGVIGVDVSAYVADETVPPLEKVLACVANNPTDHIDPGEYKAGFDDETDDFLIYPESDTSGRPAREIAVVRGQVVANSDTEIVVRYQILSPSITDGMAQSLIRQCVLQAALDYNIVDGGLSIRFERTG